MMILNMNHRIKNWAFSIIALDEINYFDFERIHGSLTLTGAFFIDQNPTGLETNVTCEAN